MKPKQTSSPAGSGVPRVEICRSLDDVERVRLDWDVLTSKASFFSAAQTLDYAIAGWEVVPKVAGTEFATILVWRDRRLVCVWPLYTRRAGSLTIATHLGTGSHEEYAGPLIWQDEDAAAIADLVLAQARGLSDVLEVYATDPTTPMAMALERARGFKYSNTILSPTISLAAHPDFDAWLATKSKSFREGLRYDRKRAAHLGKLEFVSTPDGLDGAELTAWLFATKRAQLASRGLSKSWVLEARGEAFFSRLLSRPSPSDGPKAGAQGFALKLEGRIVAGCICLRSYRFLEFFVTAFDPEFSSVSPGKLLIEDCVRWASAHGLNFDFRVSHEAYKLRWIDRFEERLTVILANRLRGAPRPLTLSLRRWIRRLRERPG